MKAGERCPQIQPGLDAVPLCGVTAMSAGAGGGGGRLSGRRRERAGSRKRWPVRGIFGLFFCVTSLVSPLLSAPQDNRREDLPPGFAPAGLSGKQFILEEIDSSGIREEVTLIFREGDVFDAARSAAKGAAGEDTGSYTYHRTGPYTGTWTIRSSGPGLPDCTAHLAFTSPASGAYTGSCADGSRRTGSFQVVHEDPYCSSLWDGLACATAANLPQVYVGASGANTASTEVVLSNTDPDPSECEVALLFHRGTSQAPPVRFNGRPEEGNLIHVTISREGAAIVTLTAPEASGLLSGAVYVYARSPCTADSLEVQGRTLIEGSDGTIEELLSLASQSPRDWLGDGDCRVLTGVFGNGRNLGFAAVAAQPGGAAPGGARFRFRSFDAGGRFIGAPSEVALGGAQELYWPWEFSEPRIIEMCLEAPGAGNFRAAVMPIGSKSTGSRVQYAAEGFVDAFRVGEATAWGVAGSGGGN